MVKLIQLKEVLRNKRFIVFTVVIPAFWYIMLTKLSGVQNELSGLTILSLAALIGIIGNSLTTFSKRISNNKLFYKNLNKTSKYSSVNYLIDQVVVQTILNLLIFILMSMVGIGLGSIEFNAQLLSIGLITVIMGWYFSIIGFTLGYKLRPATLDSASFPIIILSALMIVPFQNFGNTGLLKFMVAVEKVFPGYHLNQVIADLLHNKSGVVDFVWLLVTAIITLIPFILIIARNKQLASDFHRIGKNRP